MDWMRELFRRVRMLLDPRRFDAELEEEMRLHLELRQQEHLASGMSKENARAAARRAFGNATYIKEESRMAWGWGWLEKLAQDIRYGLRTLRKSPGFTALPVLTMALGIGATTAIFSVVDATLLHPLAYPQPEQLVRIEDDLPGLGARDVGMSVAEWHDFQRSGIFENVALVAFASVNVTGSSQPMRARFSAVGPSYFAVLGVKPELGRTFDPHDQTPGFNLEAVISDGFWKRAFASDPHVLGRSIRLDNDLYHVVGVMPAGFYNPGSTIEQRNTEVWCAVGFSGAPLPPPQRKIRLTAAVGRIKTGLTIEQAQSRVDALVASLEKQFPDDYPIPKAWTVRLQALKSTVVGHVREALILLLGAVGLVLLIGCVNIANLLLARASGRGREMAVRQALGAARPRLVRQLLTESLLLSLIGGATGLAILFFTKDFLLRMLPESLPRLQEPEVNWSVLLFGLGVSLVAGVVFGLAPAWHAGRLDLTHVLKQEGRGSTGSGQQARTRRLLVVTEFALSLIVMIAAGLLLRSFWDLLNVRLGFKTENVMAVQTWLPVPNDPKTDIYGTVAQEAPFVREVLRRGRALPGVQEIALGDLAALPLGHGRDDLILYPVIFEGHEIPLSQAPLAKVAIVTPEYFHVLGMTLERGRVLSDSDTDKTPAVVVVNEAFARTYCANEDPLAQRLKLPASGGSTFYMAAIVGVLADARTESLTEAAVPQVYLSMYQRRAKDLAVFVGGAFDTAAIPAEMRQQVQAINPELPVFGAQTLDAIRSDSLSERRFSLEMTALFAVTALLLAAMGIYGVISYAVSERTHEIGIRLALGAQRTEILRMVLRQGLNLAITGAALGLAGALAVAQLMAGLLYAVRPADPLTFATVAVLLVVVALLACYIPARRAVRVDPIVALRYE